MRRRDLLYFAYGSNLSLRRMAARCPLARPVGPATLPDHRLVFHRVASVLPAPGNRVHGAVWAITPSCEAALDRYEGFPRFYIKDVRTVVLANGEPRRAMIYVMNARRQEPPSAAYLAIIREGYRDFGLPERALDAALGGVTLRPAALERSLRRSSRRRRASPPWP